MARRNDLIDEGTKLVMPSLSEAVGGLSNKELMADARAVLSGNWGLAVLGYILYIMLIFSFVLFTLTAAAFVGMVGGVTGADVEAASGAIELASQLAEFLVSGAIVVGFCSFFLGIAQTGEAQLELLFTGFRRFWKSFGVYFLYSLFVFLWMLPAVAGGVAVAVTGLGWLGIIIIPLAIPAIIAAFRYAMAFFIVADDESCGPLEAISRSKEMMKGKKWKFFCLHWRFFWWALLATFTFGIGYLWLVPYMQTTFAKFYEDVR